MRAPERTQDFGLEGSSFMGFLFKWVMALGMMAAGGLYMSQGLGIRTPLAQYEKARDLGIPVGFVLFAGGVAMASLWKVEKHISREAMEQARMDEGFANGKRVIVKVERRAKNPQ